MVIYVLTHPLAEVLYLVNSGTVRSTTKSLIQEVFSQGGFKGSLQRLGE